MSKKTDTERREDAQTARIERAKERLRRLQQVLQCEVEEVGVREAARRLGVSSRTVQEWRCYLGLTTSLAPLRLRVARAAKRHDGDEVACG